MEAKHPQALTVGPGDSRDLPAGAAWSQASALARTGQTKAAVGQLAGQRTTAIEQRCRDLADRIEGMLLGLAVGDALGNTSESMNPADRRSAHGWISDYLPNRHAGGRAVGLASDDTQLAFWTIEQWLDDGSQDPNRLAEIFCQRQIYGIGQSVRQFQRNWRSGRAWSECGAPSAGNGALMRIAPVLLSYIRTPSRNLWGDTLIAAHLTHDDLLSNSSCVAMVHMLWQLLGLQAPPDPRWWIDTWLATSEPLSAGRVDGQFRPRSSHPPGFCGTMSDMVDRYVVPALDRNMDVAAIRDIWHSGAYLLETVPSVLYVLSRHGHDPAAGPFSKRSTTPETTTPVRPSSAQPWAHCMAPRRCRRRGSTACSVALVLTTKARFSACWRWQATATAMESRPGCGGVRQPPRRRIPDGLVRAHHGFC